MKRNLLLLCFFITALCARAQFTPGNIVVTRTGSVAAPAALTTNTTQVSLVEYTPSGTLVQTIPLVSTGTDKLTISGLGSGGTSLEGQLSLSQDRNYLSLIGYDVPAGELTTNTAISVIAVATGGTGYSYTSTVTITGGGGTGATAVINQVTAGAIVGIKITNGGSGYTSTPTIEVSGGTVPGTGFTAGAITRIPYWQSFSTKKVIARVGTNGVVDYSTKFAGSSPTNSSASPANGIVKKAVTVDGSKYWYAANRLEFIAFGSTAASTNVNAGDAPRTIEIVNNQLYYIMGFNATGFKFTNTALPEAVSTSTSTGLAMSSNSSPLGFAMVDLDPAVSWNSTGYDLVYVVDSSGGLEKYYYDGAAWIPVNSRYLPLASPLNNPIAFGTGTTLKPAAQIAVTLNASNQPVIAVIYGDAQAVGDGTSEKNGLAIVTDTSGRTGTMVSPTNIAVAYPAAPAANYAFRGVSFTPGTTTLGAASFEQKAQSWTMYPNPSKGTLNISSDVSGSFNVYNVLGQKVHQFKVENGNNTINVDNLNSGTYFVEGANATQKLMIQK